MKLETAGAAIGRGYQKVESRVKALWNRSQLLRVTAIILIALALVLPLAATLGKNFSLNKQRGSLVIYEGTWFRGVAQDRYTGERYFFFESFFSVREGSGAAFLGGYVTPQDGVYIYTFVETNGQLIGFFFGVAQGFRGYVELHIILSLPGGDQVDIPAFVTPYIWGM